MQLFHASFVRFARSITHIATACLLTVTLANTATATTLYDNLALGNDQPLPPGIDVIGPRPDAGDRFFAQPFTTDVTGTVASASILLARVGSPGGPLHFDIYNDNGGTPGTLIDRLGSVDIATVPTDIAGTAVTVEGLVDLDPNTLHYLVVDNIDLNIASLDDTFRLGMRTSPDGTNGVGRALVTAPNDIDTWLVLGELLNGANYLRMTVNAVPEPSTSWLIAIISVTTVLFQRRVRQMATK